MSCCGRGRAAAAAAKSADGTANGIANGAGGSAPVRFSYAGARTIVVRGGVTGNVYRFAPGASLRVHGADARSMAEIPGLRLAGPGL